MKARVAIIVTLLLLMIASACTHKEIVCPSDRMVKVDVMFEWDKAPGADPAGMTLYFFPAGSMGKIWRFDIPGRDGGSVELPTGSYKLLAFNNDVPGVSLTDDSGFSSCTIALKASDDLSRGCGAMYAGRIEELEITPCGVVYKREDGSVKECGYGLIRCQPELITTNYTIIFRQVKGVELIRSSQVMLSGVSSRIKPSTGASEPPSLSLLTSATAQVSQSIVTGKVTGFGDCTDTDLNEVTLQIVRNDGTSLMKKFDVTDQVINAQNHHEIVIEIAGMEIPADSVGPPLPPDSDVGISVGVDGWTVVNIDLST